MDTKINFQPVYVSFIDGVNFERVKEIIIDSNTEFIDVVLGKEGLGFLVKAANDNTTPEELIAKLKTYSEVENAVLAGKKIC